MRYRLENGLTVVLEPDSAAPAVALQAWVDVGSADETPEVEGIAHVFEHMLFKGTARRGVGEIAREVESSGGDINAWTSFDNTVYHLVLASRHFTTGLDILADAVKHSAFDPAELERELEVVLEELQQGEDSPPRMLGQALFASAFRRHPYGRPVIGTRKTVKRLTRDRLLEFFGRWYVPSNITLIATGDFQMPRAQREIERLFGGGVPTPITRTPRREPRQMRPRATVLTRDVRETQLQLAFHIPGVSHVDTAALDVVAMVLGQGESSRLNLTVLRRAELVTDVHAYAYTPRDPGLFVVGATLPAGDPAPAIDAILAEVFRCAHEEVSAAELAKARTVVAADTVYQQETVQGRARRLGYFQVVAGGLEEETAYHERVQALDAKTLRAAAARYFTAANLTIAVLAPERGTGHPRGGVRALERRLLATATAAERAARVRHAKPKARSDGDVVRVRLPGGGTLLVKRESAIPVVASRAVWQGGILREDARTNGVNSMLATLVTRGTSTRTAEELMHEVDGMAASLSGVSGRNSFGLRAETLARDWERGVELLTDCILHPALPEDELEKERRVVLDELVARDDNPTGIVFRLFAQTLYGDHPYRLDGLGTASSVRGLSRRRLMDYFAKQMPLGQLTLAVVGDVEPARVEDKLGQLLDGARAGSRPVRPRIPTWRPPVGPREVGRRLARQQAHLVVGFPGTTLAHPDRYALELVATVLSGQGGRLFVELRDRQSLAYSVSAFSVEGIARGHFAVYLSCSPDKLSAARAGISLELARLAEHAVPAEELARARRYLVGSHELALQRRSAIAATLALHEAYGLGWDDYLRYSARLAAVTAADVQRVARSYLAPDRAVVATVGPGWTPATPLSTGARRAPR